MPHPAGGLKPAETLKLEPNINPKVLGAFLIPDGTFDPLRLAPAFAGTAKHNGARFRTYHEVQGFLTDGRGNICGIKVLNRASNKVEEMRADVVVNATGAWAGQITGMAGLDAPVRPTPGIMVAYDQRFVQRAINRLNVPADGDIALPQRRMVVVGTTSYDAENVDYIPTTDDQIRLMLERGSELIPGIRDASPRGIYMAARPLLGGGSGRSIARTFKCYDHKETHNIDGLVTITIHR